MWSQHIWPERGKRRASARRWCLVCFREGSGSSICVRKNVEINGNVYFYYVKSERQEDCREFYGDTYVSQQGDSPAHTKPEAEAGVNANL